MRRANYTWPRRIHFIRNEQGIYLTLIAFGFRFHITLGRDGLPDRGLWEGLWE